MSVIRRTDVALEAALLAGPLDGSGIPVVFEAPGQDWAARRSGACLNAFLHSVVEDEKRRRSGDEPIIGENGVVVGYQPQPRVFRLSYVLSVWAKNAQDEHLVLGRLLEWSVSQQTLMVGSEPEAVEARVDLASAVGGDDQMVRLWANISREVKPALGLTLTLPIRPGIQQASSGPPERLSVEARQVPDLRGKPADPERQNTGRGRRRIAEMGKQKT